MKHIMLMSMIFTLTSCATVAPISYYEHCAVQGMKFAGVNQTSGTSIGHGSATNYQTGQSVDITTVASSSGESVTCLPPANDQEKCEINRLGQIAQPKAEYNDGINGKRLVNGIGYFFWIIPGVVAKMLYDQSREKAVVESQTVAKQIPECSREPASSVR